MADLFNFVQGKPSYSLVGNGVSASATSVTLSDFTLPDGTNITMSMFGDTGYGTFEPGTAREENISFKGVTQNGNGTATLTGVTRGLRFVAPYTADSGLAKGHGGNTPFVLSNSAPFYNELSGKDNDETITGKWTFPGGGTANAPVSGTVYSEPTDDLEYASKKYVDDTTAAGAAKATPTVFGITKLSTSAVDPTNPIAVGDNDTRVPTQSENDALQGTAGTPSNTNRYVTDDDTATTSTADAVVRGDGSGKIDNNWLDVSVEKFGGNGSDGALDTTSGVVDIDLGGEMYVVKNYTTINVTTNNLTFSNPHVNGTYVILKATGNVTISSSIVLTSIGGAGGAGGTGNGNPGQDGQASSDWQIVTQAGVEIEGQNGVNNGAGGAGGVLQFSPSLHNISTALQPGSGGGGGGAGDGATAAGGSGGNGAGSLLIECGGDLNFTGTISASGTNGGNGTANGGNGGGGGGGGAGGSVLILYNTLTSKSGTIAISGGNGGNGAAGSGSNQGGSGGGGAGSAVSAGGAGGAAGSGAAVAGSSATIGGNGGTAGAGSAAGGGGGGGASGWSAILPFVNPSL